MKKSTIILALASLIPMWSANAFADDIHIKTENSSLVLRAEVGKQLRYVYFGDRLGDADYAAVCSMRGINSEVYPAYGQWNIREYSIAVTHPDGNMTLQMQVESFGTEELHVPANGYHQATDATVTRITLKDTVYPFYVDVFFKAYKDVDMIETWTEIRHEEKKPVVLRKFDSAHLPLRTGDVWVSHLYGTWGNEGRLVEERLERGTLLIENKDGVRNSHTSHAEVMLSLDGKPRENDGAVIGAALCYSGNYELQLVTNDSDYHHLYAGISADNSEYSLPKGEVFKTPELAFTFSDEGLSGTSRNFHKWARAHKIAHGNVERRILLNSWEGVYFDINEPTMDKMMEDISSMGGELFVMDDGWFGDKYPRLTDNCALGDWVVDKNKLPHGIQWLVDAASSHNIKFGIWIEPEMANTVSEVYDAHPDWIINADNRDVATGRGGTQVILDLGNPAVQDYVFGIVDGLLTDYPEIAYIKWDANMSVSSHGTLVPKADQNKLYINYHKGFAAVCDRIREKYPDVTIQACASGGGRANYGVLPWFDEFWVSDNTDALQRIYMQWGTSYFFPSITMAQHISAVPNHTVHRVTPLKFRIDVAMSGRLGMELQPKDMKPEEIELCRKAIAEYKEVRPVIQFGDLYRLVSPYDNLGLASLMYCTEDKSEAVFFWYKTEHFQNQILPIVKMAGLDPHKNYKVIEMDRVGPFPLFFEGKVFSGAYLMANGLEIPTSHPGNEMLGYSSRVLHLIAQ